MSWKVGENKIKEHEDACEKNTREQQNSTLPKGNTNKN